MRWALAEALPGRDHHAFGQRRYVFDEENVEAGQPAYETAENVHVTIANSFDFGAQRHHLYNNFVLLKYMVLILFVVLGFLPFNGS